MRSKKSPKAIEVLWGLLQDIWRHVYLPVGLDIGCFNLELPAGRVVWVLYWTVIHFSSFYHCSHSCNGMANTVITWSLPFGPNFQLETLVKGACTTSILIIQTWTGCLALETPQRYGDAGKWQFSFITNTLVTQLSAYMSPLDLITYLWADNGTPVLVSDQACGIALIDPPVFVVSRCCGTEQPQNMSHVVLQNRIAEVFMFFFWQSSAIWSPRPVEQQYQHHQISACPRQKPSVSEHPQIGSCSDSCSIVMHSLGTNLHARQCD